MTINLTAFTGSPTISTTEYSLPNASTTQTPRTEVGMYQLMLDLSALVAGDEYTLRIKERIVGGGTPRMIDRVVFSGAQATPGTVYPALLLGLGWDMTLQRTGGVDRVIPYTIRSVA
jgi:hypothetical protein